MDPETLYLLGPGTTIQYIMEELDLQKTLLGIDAVYDREFQKRCYLECIPRVGEVRMSDQS